MLPRFLLLLLPLLASCATVAPQPSRGMVSAADPRAAEAGREILAAGGSAADAALAMMVALTVVEPQSSGLGGGSFLVHHDEARDRISTYDGRETAPAGAGPAYFLTPDGSPQARSDAVRGGRSIGVPGNVRQMALIHRRHGKLPWARLFAPAVRLARDGFLITPRLRASLGNNRELAALTPWGRAQFYGADGEPKPVGTVIANPALAALLVRLAERGPDSFYVGPDADALLAAARGAPANPALLTAGDLATYEAKERAPVCGRYRAYKICGMGPPSSGATTVFAILKQLERFDLRALGPDNPAAWHLIGESMRLAYADRDAFIGDPDFVSVPVSGLTDGVYLARRSRLISATGAMATAPAGDPPGATRAGIVAHAEVPATSHMVAAVRAGNVASLTSTIEGPFGSGVTVNGLFLNNELTDFTFEPEAGGRPVANRVEGGKRPRSSMSPTIVYGPDGEVRAAIGAAGGPTIIAQVAKAIIAMLDWDMEVQAAIAAPTIMGVGDRVLVERGTALEAMAPALRALGANVVVVAPGYKANGIERVGAAWRGGADPRSEGVAIPE